MSFKIFIIIFLLLLSGCCRPCIDAPNRYYSPIIQISPTIQSIQSPESGYNKIPDIPYLPIQHLPAIGTNDTIKHLQNPSTDNSKPRPPRPLR